jgi:leucyl-tRNA synthetase
VLHLLYSRFWHKVLFDCGLVSTREPFRKLFNQGMVLAYSYQDAAGKYYHPSEAEERDGEWVAKESGAPLTTQIEKMSKSRLNVVNPDEVIDAYGADAMRLYELFIGPLSASAPWQMAGVEGVYRFLQRVWRLVVEEEDGGENPRLRDAPGASEEALWRLLHKTIRSVTEETEGIDKMNTAISQMMVFVNAATASKTLPRETVKVFLRLLSPYAPHLAEELWSRLGETELIAHAPWPEYDEALCRDETVVIPVQVNGKVRARLEVPADISREALEEAALAEEKVAAHVEGKTVAKVIVVPGKLVNVAVKG